MASDIDELLEWLRSEEADRRIREAADVLIRTPKADSFARWITAVERLQAAQKDLQAFRATHLPRRDVGRLSGRYEVVPIERAEDGD